MQDEFADHVDAGGFTMPMFATTLLYANSFRKLFGMKQNQTWNDMAENILVSRDAASGITMEYTTMNGSTNVKQADIVLNTFPLRYTDDYSPQNALLDLDYVCYTPSSFSLCCPERSLTDNSMLENSHLMDRP